MPIVRVYATSTWLPSEETLALRAGVTTRGLLPEWRTTRNLIGALPAMTLQAIEEVDRVDVSNEIVFVMPSQMHPWTINNKDIWVDVQPRDAEEWGQRPDRRAAVATLLRDRVRDFLRRQDPRPSCDVEVRPLDAAGATIEASGELSACWGGVSNDG